MLVSANRTVVEAVAVHPIAGAEAIDLGCDLSLLLLEARELAVSIGQGAQVLANERADRAATLGGTNPRIAIHVVWDRDRDVLHEAHSITTSQFHNERCACDLDHLAVRGS